MIRASVITLIGEDPSAHGLYDDYEPIRREVFAEVRSVGMRESYEALSVGLKPELVFRLEIAQDYQDERQLVYNDTPYRVVRTYLRGDGIELVCERLTGDV